MPRKAWRPRRLSAPIPSSPSIMKDGRTSRSPKSKPRKFLRTPRSAAASCGWNPASPQSSVPNSGIIPFMPYLLCLVLALAAPCALSAVDGMTHPAKIVTDYAGGYKDDFPQELNSVKSFILSAQSDIATRMGLQYGQGFLHPVTLRFDDGAPAVNENPFFYVQSKSSGDAFTQEIVVNVEAFARRRSAPAFKESSLRGGFRYALTELMLNDL